MFNSVFGQGFSNKVGIYVPSTVNVAEPASQELVNEWVIATHKFLAGQFGGATSQAALGSFVASDGTLVTESIVIVSSYASQVTDENVTAVLEFVDRLKVALSQESIGLEVNNVLYLT